MKRTLLYISISLFISISVSAQKKIELEDVITLDSFAEKTIEGLNSMNDGLHYTSSVNGTQIVKYSYKTGEQVGVVFDLNKVENKLFENFEEYTFSADETKILFITQKEMIYRRSFSAEYYIWNSVTEELTELSAKGRQQAATFSPDGDRVAFIRDYNIFIKNLKFGTESQVSWDGKHNEILNGIPDWVYEEEFFMNQAFEWSPDSKMLAYIRFDERNITDYSMPVYKGLDPSYEENKTYPGSQSIKYPKAGEKNSTIEVRVYEIKSKSTIIADIGEDEDIYVPRLKWTPDGNDLGIMRLNRNQNKMDMLLANPYTGDTRLYFTEKNQSYISEDFLDDFIFLPDNEHFVINSERDGYSHLYLYNRQGFELKQITEGEFDVTDFYGYDEQKKLFYYQAAKESPLQREVYYVSLDGKKFGKLSTKEGTNKAVFSTGFKYFINYYTNITTPNEVKLYDYKGNLIRTLEDNADLKAKLQTYVIPQKEFFSFKTSENIELNGWMIKPNNFNYNTKYPVVIVQYSGPCSQEVVDQYEINWNNYLAQEGYLVVCVDPRGTEARGEEFRKSTYMQLGKLEAQDLVETAKYLGKQSYADKDNIAIWGWSYGGFTTIKAMEEGGDLFKAGISVAPVTNFRYYDSAYTERYMRRPQDNADGYDDNSVFVNPKGIKGRLLLVHGSADDNVHLQNSMEFAELLVQKGIQFDMAIYTNRDHHIKGGNTRMHLYQRFNEFLSNQLKK